MHELGVLFNIFFFFDCFCSGIKRAHCSEKFNSKWYLLDSERFSKCFLIENVGEVEKSMMNWLDQLVYFDSLKFFFLLLFNFLLSFLFIFLSFLLFCWLLSIVADLRFVLFRYLSKLSFVLFLFRIGFIVWIFRMRFFGLLFQSINFFFEIFWFLKISCNPYSSKFCYDCCVSSPECHSDYIIVF